MDLAFLKCWGTLLRALLHNYQSVTVKVDLATLVAALFRSRDGFKALKLAVSDQDERRKEVGLTTSVRSIIFLAAVMAALSAAVVIALLSIAQFNRSTCSFQQLHLTATDGNPLALPPVS